LNLITIALFGALASAWADSFSFAVVGDTQGSGTLNYEVMPRIIQDMNAMDPALVFFVGDLIGGYYTIEPHQAAWEEWVAEAWQLDAEVYAVPGNHDFFPGEAVYDAWLETFDWLPTGNSPAGQEGMSYHFDYGDCRFVSVLTDSEWGQTSPDQAWLDGVLADPDTQASDHVFVFSHHPVSFSTAEPLGNTADAFWQSLVFAGVDGFFAGHWHRYQPSQLGAGGDTWETIVGTGGGEYYAPWRDYQQLHGFLLVVVEDARVTATFYGDEDGDGAYDDVMDEYVIAWEGEPPTGLVAHYGFEGDGTDDAPPPLGKGVHGEAQGAVYYTDGAQGRGIEYQGAPNAAFVAGSIGDYNLSINGDLTVSIFAERLGSAFGTWGSALLTYGTSDYYSEDEETNYSYWLSLAEGGRLRGFWEHGDGEDVIVHATDGTDHTSGWHNYAMVRDAAAMQVRFYIDGEQQGEPVGFEHLPTGGGRGMLWVGRDVEGSNGYTYGSGLDELCIFNRVLSESELAAIAGGWDCMFDQDGDGQDDSEGDCDDSDAVANTRDEDGDGFSSCEDDCDDHEPSTHPDAEEICDDGVDNDCNGLVDEVDCEDDTGDVSDDTAEPGDTDHPGDEPEDPEEGCGCAGTPSPAGLALLAPLAGVLLTRRRSLAAR
jgi:hypothetical protein